VDEVVIQAVGAWVVVAQVALKASLLLWMPDQQTVVVWVVAVQEVVVVVWVEVVVVQGVVVGLLVFRQRY